MARLRILESTLKRLFALTGNRCAFPECEHAVVNQDGDLIAEVCHIEAAEEGGQRFNPKQMDKKIRHIDNLIVLCPTHHKTTDNVDKYPVERLREVKREHEDRYRDQPPKISSDEIDRLIGRLTGIAVSKLPAGATRTKLIGRSTELRKLTNALNRDTHVLSLVAWGGTGKSALTAHWMVRLAKRNWGDIERYFDWSFYSQGTKGEQGTSADLFIAEALRFFGDPDPQAGSPHDRGDRLARLAAEQPTLLILDGLEPMQFGPGPQEGLIKDPALKSLLKGIAQRPFRGLLLITTREPIKDLVPFLEQTVVELPLDNLTEAAGAELLHHLEVRRAGAKSPISPDDHELRNAVSEVNGHALTLQLMATYLARTQGGDIRRRDRFGFEKASKTTSDEHAFRVIAAYERWLSGQFDHADDPQPHPEGERMLAVLRMLGLFDRPVPPGCLNDLRNEPVIEGLNDAVVHASDDDWNSALTHLQDLGLITLVGAEASSTGLPSDLVVDAHPLIREFFAKQLCRPDQAQRRSGNDAADDRADAGASSLRSSIRPTDSPTAWTEGHRRVFEYLCKSTEHRPDGVAGLAPLYQAISHGCHAGLHQQALYEVYADRVQRGTGYDGFYGTRMLGAIGADLGAVACFFDQPWSRLSSNLAPDKQAFLFNDAANCLPISKPGRLGSGHNNLAFTRCRASITATCCWPMPSGARGRRR